MPERIMINKNTMHRRPALLLDLGITDYNRALELQNDLVAARKNKSIQYDRIILTEHRPVFTLGKNGGKENLVCSEAFLKARNIQICETTRGGNITFHGPGQIILYPIVDLNTLSIDVPEFITRLEEIMILTCKNCDINAHRSDKNPGVWVDNDKLGNIGISIKKGICFHGLSLNVNLDLEPFSWINPCGLNDIGITSIEKEMSKNKTDLIDPADIKTRLLENFESVFNYELKYKNESTIPGISNLKDNKKISRKKPVWLKRNLPKSKGFEKIRNILIDEKLNTVCQSANCPNKWECFCSGTSTFMLLGNQCTRNCKFCNIKHGRPSLVDENEPDRIANAVYRMNLNYVVLTSVTRDDLEDGGAGHFSKTICKIREKMNNNCKIEVLIPDFKGSKTALKIVLDAKPDVLNHNIETVPFLYSTARPEADYNQSLTLFKNSLEINPEIPVKTGIMVGLGENFSQIGSTMNDLLNSGCSLLTIGQYLQPSKGHLPVYKYYMPEEFYELEKTAKKKGFAEVASGPFVRSSYKAETLLKK